MKVIFERTARAYLPELTAYLDYLKTFHPEIDAYDSNDLSDYDPLDFDVVWRFMGLDRKAIGRYVIHEYNSLSIAPFPHLKNWIKKAVNAKPDGRAFLNPDVKADFGFNDGVPDTVRDMGIDPSFFVSAPLHPEYDFVYAGSLDRGAVMRAFLDLFKTELKTASLLIVGNVPDDINEAYGNMSNITFTGRVPYQDVAKYIAKGRYGVNLTPDIYPMNRQAATKVLEYSAVGIPVISLDYQWIREFAVTKNAKFFTVQPDMSNLNLTALDQFTFKIPDVSMDTWENVIRRSGIFDLLPR